MFRWAGFRHLQPGLTGWVSGYIQQECGRSLSTALSIPLAPSPCVPLRAGSSSPRGWRESASNCNPGRRNWSHEMIVSNLKLDKGLSASKPTSCAKNSTWATLRRALSTGTCRPSPPHPLHPPLHFLHCSLLSPPYPFHAPCCSSLLPKGLLALPASSAHSCLPWLTPMHQIDHQEIHFPGEVAQDLTE